MEKKELQKVLDNHKKWLVGYGGQGADLQGADLRGADLRGADLQGADLRGAYLRGAYLQDADLQGADLRGADLRGADLQGADLRGAYLQDADLQGADLQRADLRGADLQRADLRGAYLQRADLQGADLQGADLRGTVLQNINWLSYIGIIVDKDGTAYGYKLVNLKGEGIYKGGLNYFEDTKFKVPKVDKNINAQCSFGINLATFQWCLNNRQSASDQILLMKFHTKDAVCPQGSDGKFRVKACVKVGAVDWNGNIIKDGQI